MSKLSKVKINQTTVSPGNETGDKIISTPRGFFVTKIVLNSDVEIDKNNLQFKLSTFKIGGTDRLGFVVITPLGDYDSVSNAAASYTLTCHCAIKIDDNVGLSIPFDKKLDFSIAVSTDGGTTWENAVPCAIDVVVNTGVDINKCVPEILDRNAVVDVAPVDITGKPVNTNKPIKFLVKAVDGKGMRSAKTYVNIALNKDAVAGVFNDKKLRFFQMKTDGTVGDELFFDNRNNTMIRTTVSTDGTGSAVIACYATRKLSNTNGIYTIRLALLLSNGMEVYANDNAVFLTTLAFNSVYEIPEIEGQNGNMVSYDENKTGLKVRIQEYPDWTPSDRILIINNGYNYNDDQTRVCAEAESGEGLVFFNYVMDVSYLDVIPNDWNNMRFIVIQGDNVKISGPNLWDFKSPDVINVDPPVVDTTEPLPELIFTAEDHSVYKIGKQFDYSLNSSCVNYGGTLELIVNFTKANFLENDLITVSYGIKAFKEGVGKREPRNVKEVLTDVSWKLTKADITAGKKTIQLPQSKFIGFDEDENGKLGSMWIMANIGLTSHSEILYADIDTVAPGE
ncbi:hypothetical protein NP681_004489 [Salmonella enterica]|nr:hypothetical protein [Salmonella enterica]EJR3519421.1 hypothetical protein [Salmonella enterica]